MRRKTKKQKQFGWRQYNLPGDDEIEEYIPRTAWKALGNLEKYTNYLKPERIAEEESMFQWKAIEHAYEGAYSEYYKDEVEEFFKHDIKICAKECRYQNKTNE